MTKNTHNWDFFRAGGVDQVVLRSGEDLEHLRELDQKLWVALACPTVGTELDDDTLLLLDEDGDGRIRPPEVLAAIEWSAKVFSSLDLLMSPGSAVPLSAFSSKTEEGKAAGSSAKRILKETGKKDAKEIDLDTVKEVVKAFVETRFNGDGVVPADSAEDEATKLAIEDVLTSLEGVPDRSGKQGINREKSDAFFEQLDKALAWFDAGKKPEVLTLAADSESAFEAFAAVRAKIDDYFARCRLTAFDPRAAAALNPQETELVALSPLLLDASHESVKKLPLARIEAGKSLPLDGAVNPAWIEQVRAFADLTVKLVLGSVKPALSEAEWLAIKEKLAGFGAWRADKPEGKVMELGEDRLRAIHDGGQKAAIEALIEQDLELEDEFNQITHIERAVRYRRDLVQLLRNFVNFSEFYNKKTASFIAGKLYIDARSCDLVTYVNDAAKHAALAGLSSAYLMYCDITRPCGEKKAIVAAMTNGDTDNLMVGRNGVFYDRDGKDWDATITAIVDNPISVRQAFWSPYKRLVRLVEEQVAKRAAEKEKAASADVDKMADTAANADKTPAVDPSKPAVPAKKMDVGTVAAIGVAVAGFATFLSAALGTFFGLGKWMPLGVLAIMLAISGPSMLIAWLKLRRRNIGPILDANGWAINSPARINVPFGSTLTQLGELPEGASRSLADPYAEKKTPWPLYVALAILIGLGLAWLTGNADAFLPTDYQQKTVFASATATPASSGSPAASAAPAAPAAP